MAKKKQPRLRVVGRSKAKAAPDRSGSDSVSSAHGSDSLRERLAPFLANNPESSYTRSQPKGPATIELPWGDPTLSLKVEPSNKRLIDALCSVRLLPRFTAIWHKDSNRLEVIYTALPVSTNVRERKYEFVFEGRAVACSFGDASDRLLAISQAARFEKPATPTQHRNLTTFRLWDHLNSEHPTEALPAPTSFWMENAPADENELANLACHLNFYVSYYDQVAPYILVHEDEPTEETKIVGLPHGPFPPRIDGRPIDPYLLLVWQSLLGVTDPFRRFLYAYQVLEFRAFYFIQDKMLEVFKRVLASPDLVGRIDVAARQVLDAVTETIRSDDDKLEAMIRSCVDPENIWTQIEPNLKSFTEDRTFDGGFVLERLFLKEPTRQDFVNGWGASKFPGALRKLRNALVHGREKRQAYAIAPTRRNHELVRPWLGPIVVTAQEALIFGC